MFFTDEKELLNMAQITLQGTQFIVEVLAASSFSFSNRVKLRVAVQNEHISYDTKKASVAIDEMEEWIFAMHRLLAGGYSKETNITFEYAGFAVDLFPHTKDGEETSRTERRENDCKMCVHFIMKQKNKDEYLGGVYSIIFHREDIRVFAESLRKEFYERYESRLKGRGKYLFAGLSPLGYGGCNYWYFDPSNSVASGDYVWVKMGRHDLLQIARVDTVRRFNDDSAPYDPATVKQVLRKATEEELKNL